MTRATRAMILAVGAFLWATGCSDESTMAPAQTGDASSNETGWHVTPGDSETTPLDGGAPETIPLDGGTWTVPGVIDPGQVWVDEAGGVHARDLILAMEILGDLAGTGEFVQHSNWNAQGNGALSGTMSVDVTLQTDGGPVSGTFQGHYGFAVQGLFVDDTIILDGSGDFEGMRFHFHTVGLLGGDFEWSGFLRTFGP